MFQQAPVGATERQPGLVIGFSLWRYYGWQIELLFKLWKSHGGVEESRSDQAYRVLCEVYAKLLAMVVQHWLLLLGGGGFSARSQRKAARQVRRQAVRVAAALGRRRELRRVLRVLLRPTFLKTL